MSMAPVVCNACKLGWHARCSSSSIESELLRPECTCSVRSTCKGWKSWMDGTIYEMKDATGTVIKSWVDELYGENTEGAEDEAEASGLKPCCQQTLLDAAAELAGHGDDLLDTLAEWLANRAEGK